MDDGFAVGMCVFLMAMTGILSGLITYEAAKGTVREQAIAAQVACYVPNANGTTEFRWNCKQQ